MWARELRHVLSVTAEEIEADPSLSNQRLALSELMRKLAALTRDLPLPDEPMDELDLAPLKILSVALSDLSNGANHPLFALKRRAGRTKSSFTQQRERAHAIAFVSLFMEAGTTRAQAEKLVARAFSMEGIVGRGGKAPTENTIHSWFEESRTYGVRPREGDLANEYVNLLKRSGLETSRADINRRMRPALRGLNASAKPLI